MCSKFRVLYDDTGKETVHSLLETNVLLIEDQFEDEADDLELIRQSLSDWSKKDLQVCLAATQVHASYTNINPLRMGLRCHHHCLHSFCIDHGLHCSRSEQPVVQRLTVLACTIPVCTGLLH